MIKRTRQFIKCFKSKQISCIRLFDKVSICLLFSCFFFCKFFHASAEEIDVSKNPFVIDFPEKIEHTNEDYVFLQKQLRRINLRAVLLEHYFDLKNQIDTIYEFWFFYSRCTKFLFQEFINEELQLFPRKELIKINDGGNNCVVSAAPYAKDYPSLLLSQIEALKHTGFNGYFLMFLGAYPNPTGKEIRYAGVPYAFKIFAMMEAQKLGFNNILWTDSSLYPTRDITPIFDEIEKTGFIAHYKQCTLKEEAAQLFPSTREVLKQLTSVDVLQGKRLFATMIGLKMNHPLAVSFVNQHYDFVKLGLPFLSGLPEEFVYSAILGQTQYSEWMDACARFENSLPMPCFRKDGSAPGCIPDSGYFFDWRSHLWVDLKGI